MGFVPQDLWMYLDNTEEPNVDDLYMDCPKDRRQLDAVGSEF